MWLLKSSSAKKINKPFDHKGPIHSLSLSASLFLSFSPPHPPPTLILGSFSSTLLSWPLFFIHFPSFKTSPRVALPSIFNFLLYLIYTSIILLWLNDKSIRETDLHRETDRHHLTSQGADRQTETQTRASLFHKHTVMLQSRGTRHGKCLHRSIFSTKHEQGLRRKVSPPATQTFSAVTNIHWLPHSDSTTVCVSVFSYAYRWGWCEKASPITVLLSRVSAAHSGCGSVTICPLRPVFHFKNTPDFLR